VEGRLPHARRSKAFLNVTIGENGKVIFYCHVCPAGDRKAWCSEVLTKLGLRWADLQPFYSNQGVRTKKSAASEGIRPDMQARVDRAGDTYFGMLDKVDQVAWWHGFYSDGEWVVPTVQAATGCAA
jgi:hypothetical protein